MLRQPVPRQVDKKYGVPEGEKGLWNSGGGKDNLFILHSLVRIL